MIENRLRPSPSTRIGYIEQIPALTLLDRLPMPIIAVGLDDGAVVYTNPATADLLGYPDARSVNVQSLSSLMAAHAHARPSDCVAALNAAHTDGATIEWNHLGGFPIRTITSRFILVRDDDPVSLIGLVDVTELSCNR